MNKAKLKIEKVSKVFVDENKKKIETLRQVMFEVKENEIVAIVGRSGCGKTTLLKIIAGLIDSQAGEVILDSNEVISGINSRIGLVPQNPVSFAWLSVVENVAFALKFQGTNKKERLKKAKQYIELVGLSGFEDSYIKNLSGGMKQRVVLATVLASDPEILLMDEPFSALDCFTKSIMQDLLLKIWQESKKTIVFITHDVEEAVFLADKIYIMDSNPGKIKQAIKVDLPRPRVADIKLTPGFNEIKKQILQII